MDRIGTCDGYVVLKLRDQSFTSKVIKNTLNPVWFEEFEFSVFDYENDKLIMTVYDHDLTGLHDRIGTVEIPVKEYYKYNDLEWISIKVSSNSIFSFYKCIDCLILKL